jgi:hypothetical protein
MFKTIAEASPERVDFIEVLDLPLTPPNRHCIAADSVIVYSICSGTNSQAETG